MTVTATTAKGTIATDMTKKDMIKRVSIKKALTGGRDKAFRAREAFVVPRRRQQTFFAIALGVRATGSCESACARMHKRR